MTVSTKQSKSKKRRPSDPAQSPKPKRPVAPAESVETPPAPLASPGRWAVVRPYVLVGAATLVCLLPFIGKALHIDDTLFIWAGQNILKHPFDPFGFRLNWNEYEQSMSEVTKNPPLACYYAAGIGGIFGWSEHALHLGFLVPALIVILSTYYLAKRLTNSPMVASLASLLAPGFLVSATSLMCDTMMVALWLLAVIFWIRGLDTGKHLFLVLSAVLIGACALTKYFGASLILLLLAYSWYRQRRIGSWVCYLLVPVAILAGYQYWTASLYGKGLLMDAAGFASTQRENASSTTFGAALEGLSFAGGCMLPALTFAWLIWSRKQILAGAAVSLLAAAAMVTGLVSLGAMVGGASLVSRAFHAHWFLFGGQLTLYIAGGISILGLAIADFWERRSADALLLMLWVLGTYAFAGFFNWVVNARSVLPLIPAAAILLARRLPARPFTGQWQSIARVAAPLLASGIVAVWVTSADSHLANSARTAASLIQAKTKDVTGQIWFEGHWGFQYYMEQFHARPLNTQVAEVHSGDVVVIPSNNTGLMRISPNYIAGTESIDLPGPRGATTVSSPLGAGFYASYWGPLPFVLSPIPDERYAVLHIRDPQDSQ